MALLAASAGAGSALTQRRKLTTNKEQAYVAALHQRLQNELAWVSSQTNGPALWTKVRQSIAGVLAAEWRNGKLKGQKPAEAYFVRCDRTTMTQNDISNRRLICMVGVATLRPAEFVTFRISQNTR